ncbi:MAG: class II glutamine amidotransferase [Rhodothermales bacterium]
MCRVVAYLGSPLLLDVLLYRSDSSLVRQAYDPSMLSFMNLAGSGFAAWDSASPRPEVPFLYKDTLLPMYDSNLIQMSGKIRSECMIAHVRGEDYYGGSAPQVGRANLHPFQYEGAGLAMAHNGGLARFAEMKYHLLPHIREEVAARIEGTTDSEWLYALLLSRFEGSAAEAGPDELASAVVETLRIVRAVRDEHGIDVASGVNLFASNGTTLVATRFSYDFGCYDGQINERQLVYHSLWFTAGQAYGRYEDEWRMGGSMDEADSILIASEPLTRDASSWIEVPEYTLLTATRTDGRLALTARDLDL